MADVNFRNLFITLALYNYIEDAKIQNISDNLNFIYDFVNLFSDIFKLKSQLIEK